MKYCPWNRPFDSVEEMDAHLIRMWNDVVQEEDTVYFLGDFSMKFRIALQVLPQLKGTKHLIAGNHDAWFRSNGKSSDEYSSVKELRDADPSIATVSHRDTISIGGYTVLLCHFPWFGDKDEHSEEHNAYDDRYSELKPHRAKIHCDFLLHGHVHNEPHKKIGRKSLDVGFDPWGRMVSTEDIIKVIESQVR